MINWKGLARPRTAPMVMRTAAAAKSELTILCVCVCVCVCVCACVCERCVHTHVHNTQVPNNVKLACQHETKILTYMQVHTWYTGQTSGVRVHVY